MKASLDLKIGQRLSMTPQLQQAIKLLQMSSLDLQTEIQQALETNPLLSEVDGDAQDAEFEPSGVDRTDTGESADESTTDGISEEFSGESDVVRSDDRLNGDELAGDKALDNDFDAQYDPPIAPTVTNNHDGDGLDAAARSAQPDSLHDHVMWQIASIRFSALDRHIANTIVFALDDTGYLNSSVEELAAMVNVDLGLDPDAADSDALAQPVTAEEIGIVLRQIQNLEPVGIGARNLVECLLLQIERLADDSSDESSAKKLAAKIVVSHLESLAARDFESVKKKLKVSDEELKAAIDVIQSLDARPGNQIAPALAEYVLPDVVVRRSGSSWGASLNTHHLPKLEVNNLYAKLIERGKKTEQNEYLREHVNDARFFIKSLQNRHETLLRVARAIVARQQQFFDEGDEAMKPMVLGDIASELDLHESTISRATTQKYMLTPHGVFELKYFFSTGLSNAAGDEHSSTAIRSMIKSIIEDEPVTKPISDSKIATQLATSGVKVARRTVAKYREAMNIPPSNQRKQLG